MGRVKQNIYGDLDKPAQAIDENGNSTFVSYDAGGNTTSVADPEGHTSQAQYDLSSNNILWSKNVLGRQTTFG